MPFEDVLVHTGIPLRRHEASGWVEGRYDAEPERGEAFDCVVFLPEGSSTVAGRRRMVREPTMLYWPEDRTGEPVALVPEDEVLVIAPELNEAEGNDAELEVRWTVTGSPQPFGKPGDPIIGLMVTLRRVDD